ncbi:DNA damage tolerance protein RHC31 [Paramyrothecium foliicola]|nr:DNA damage tolerance protein RHC31 [Paramyrothecium foliicola]
MEQQGIDPGAGPAADPSNPQLLYADVSNQVDPNAAIAGMVPSQAFMPDPSMAALPMMQSSLPMMLANGGAEAHALPHVISADEIALYDRQIRLWGMEAQARIQNANILLITIRALASEVAKNLVLAGIGSLTILDGAIATEADLGAQFLLSESDIGQNRAQAASVNLQKLNPRVKINVDVEGVKTKGPSYFAGFDIVIATDLDPDSFNLINTATRLNGKAFYAAGVHGMYGFIFSDLIEHDYVIERDVGNVSTELKQETRTRAIIDVKTKKEGSKTTESVTKRELYSTWFLASDAAGLPEEYTKSKRRLRSVTPALPCLRALWDFMQIQNGRLPSNRDDLKMFTQFATSKHKALGLPSETLKPEFLRSFLQNLGSEIAPVTAILGGQLAQDVINVLGRTQQPIQNMVIFDGTTMESLMYPLHPDGTLGASLLSLGGVEPLPPNGNNMLMGDLNGMAPVDPMGLGGFVPSGIPGMPAPEGMFMDGIAPNGMMMTGLPANVSSVGAPVAGLDHSALPGAAPTSQQENVEQPNAPPPYAAQSDTQQQAPAVQDNKGTEGEGST